MAGTDLVAVVPRVLAERLQAWRDDGVRETRFLIGAADGFGDAERAEADLLIALGTLALHFPEIAEIDLNPIIVVDGAPKVADALIVKRASE